MITPQDIRQQTFRRAMRGFDREEVLAFLQALAQEWEEQQNKLKEVKEELERTKASYRTLKEVEDMLHRTLMQAEQSARDTVENARQKAELKIREAEARSQEILRQGVEDRNSVQREIEELIRRRDHLFTQMQVYLKTQLERLQDFDRAELPAYGHSYASRLQEHQADTSEAEKQAETASTGPKKDPQAEKSAAQPDPSPDSQPEEEESFFDQQRKESSNGTPAGKLYDDIIDEL